MYQCYGSYEFTMIYFEIINVLTTFVPYESYILTFIDNFVVIYLHKISMYNHYT